MSELAASCRATTFVRPGLIVVYLPCWLDTEKLLFHELQRDLNWQQGSIRLFGRDIPEPRLTGWVGDVSYVYSGRVLEPRPWLAPLIKLRELLGTTLNSFVRPSFMLNHCLVNWYRVGADSMGWHQDNEATLGRNPVIASVSLGQRRRFRLRHKASPKAFDTLTFELGEGDLLIMYGCTQHNWEHELPKITQKIAPRMNLTFRSVLS